MDMILLLPYVAQRGTGVYNELFRKEKLSLVPAISSAEN